MKTGIHPDYKEAIFLDTSTGHKFLTRTTMTSKETVKWEDGKDYPLIRVDISAYSHPYFTGKMKYVDDERSNNQNTRAELFYHQF